MRYELLKKSFRQRHASLSLSINSIVVLIMAITMLGLGLAFMKNMFGGASQQFMQASDEVKNQMYEKLKTSDKRIGLSSNEVTVSKGKDTTIYAGIKNFGDIDNTKFTITLNCLDATTTAVGCNGAAVASGGSIGVASGDVTFNFIKTTKDLKKEEVAVIPIGIKVKSNAGEATFSMTITSTGGTLSASDTFYVTVQ